MKVRRYIDSKSNRKSGFTLVELMLYIAILGVMLTSLVAFMLVSYQSRIKNQTIAEVEQQGSQIIELILQNIRNAESINSPVSQASGTSLSLATTMSGTNPTVFDVNSGSIRIKEGTGALVNLTSNRVTATGVTFTNVSESGAPGAVRVQFTLNYINNSGTNEYDYSKTFYGSGSLR